MNSVCACSLDQGVLSTQMRMVKQDGSETPKQVYVYLVQSHMSSIYMSSLTHPREEKQLSIIGTRYNKERTTQKRKLKEAGTRGQTKQCVQ